VAWRISVPLRSSLPSRRMGVVVSIGGIWMTTVDFTLKNRASPSTRSSPSEGGILDDERAQAKAGAEAGQGTERTGSDRWSGCQVACRIKAPFTRSEASA